MLAPNSDVNRARATLATSSGSDDYLGLTNTATTLSREWVDYYIGLVSQADCERLGYIHSNLPTTTVGSEESPSTVYLKINTAGWTPDVYSVHIWANDSTAHINHSIFTFTVGNTAPNTSIESIVPNPAKYGLENVSVEWIATDFNMDANYTNVSYPNGSILATYYQNFTLETSNLTQVGNYSILVWAKDELGMVNWTLDTLIVYNYTPPTIALISPADSYWFNENNVTFFFRPEDDEDIVNCTVIIDNELNQSNTSAIIRNVTNNITTSIGDGTYTWTVNCTDNNSYVGTNTSTRTLAASRVCILNVTLTQAASL